MAEAMDLYINKLFLSYLQSFIVLTNVFLCVIYGTPLLFRAVVILLIEDVSS